MQLYASSNSHISSRYTPKPKKRNIFNLTPLDKDFIRAYYGDQVMSGLSRDEAARRIAHKLLRKYTAISSPHGGAN